MDNQYDGIGVKYKEAREAPVTRYLEAPSVIAEVGPVDGRSVIDFACGDGYFTRIWQRLGAAAVLGVDLSPQMIDLARRQEEAEPIGVSYLVADAAIEQKFGAFDLATAIFLFNYANDAETLADMVANVAGNLVDGGRLVAVTPNPDFVNGRRDTLPYGYLTEALSSNPLGVEVRMSFTGESPFAIEFMQWRKSLYEKTLADAGFGDIRWTFFSVSDEGMQRLGEDFWRATLENPKSVILSAVKK
jgi:toxoflavin synthase